MDEMDERKILSHNEIEDLLTVMVSSGAEIEPFPINENQIGNFELLQVKKKRQRKKIPIIVLYDKKN